MIGLCGAQRVGKSTLADAFAQRHNLTFVKTSTSGVFAAIGKDPKIEYPVEERIAIQEAILYALERQYAAAHAISPMFIADRTPMDLAMYMLADIQRSTLAGAPELSAMVNDYVQRCYDSTNQWFSTVVLVQPGIKLVEEAGKAPACPANIEHLNALIGGLLLDPRLMARQFMIPRQHVFLEHRISALANAVKSAIDFHNERRAAMKTAGIYLH